MLTLIVVSVVVVGLAVAGIAIKMFLQKDGKFTKTCSSVELSTGEKVGCVCGKGKPEKCVNAGKPYDEMKKS